ncbi:hypothetical protein XELAEV_18032057mg [Xenopus laevis]|uniref:Uncharacterized protein n=1 Tax=Xenopus laevis TaxID=8355 RepID=A0A974CNW8_XENLA|nr:hypothetical protein XELAEV_18032057mg [Xenopus laevis]
MRWNLQQLHVRLMVLFPKALDSDISVKLPVFRVTTWPPFALGNIVLATSVFWGKSILFLSSGVQALLVYCFPPFSFLHFLVNASMILNPVCGCIYLELSFKPPPAFSLT